MQHNFPNDGLVRLPEVIAFLSISKSTWWKGVKDGKFPQALKLGGITAWRAKEIRALVD